MLKKSYNYFSKFELILWFASIFLIICSFIVFDRANYMILVASLIGATSLIFNAKGNPFGQFLMIYMVSLAGLRCKSDSKNNLMAFSDGNKLK